MALAVLRAVAQRAPALAAAFARLEATDISDAKLIGPRLAAHPQLQAVASVFVG